MEPVLTVRNVEKYYGSRGSVTKAVDDISFTVEKGEFVGVMGASGSGKTTLLNCIATIDRVSAGHIFVGGRDVTALGERRLSAFRREELGFIFQDYNLLDTLTAFENIALALTIRRTPPKEIRVRVEEVAQRLGVFSALPKYPYQLSGGEKQRIAAARAIVGNPSLILADEPTGSLDSRSARVLLESLGTLHSALKATILMVTHDAFTASYCGRILFIKDGKLFSELRRGEAGRGEFLTASWRLCLCWEVTALMLCKLAFRNVTRSIRDFTVYFLTLAFGVCLFYVFNSIDAQQAMIALSDSQKFYVAQMTEIMAYVSVFVAVVFGLLVVYANRFLMKRRKRELGMYLLLGMERSGISRILIAETFLIGLFALAAGLTAGVFLSQIVSVFTARLFEADLTSFHFILSRRRWGKRCSASP